MMGFEELSNAGQPSKDVASPLQLKPAKKVNILIVDDKPANIVSLEAILSEPTYNLMSATSGPDALKQILHHDFAVILLDVMMPDMDGFEVARFIRQRGRSEVTPIIFLTAIATEFRYLQEGYAVGAVDYLQKPLDPTIVQAKVAVFVELYRRNERIKQQEAQLREMQRLEQEHRFNEFKLSSEKHYQELAENIPQIVFTLNASAQPTYLNKRWFEFTGLPLGQGYTTEGRLRVTHPEDRDAFLNCLGSAKAPGQNAEVELRLLEQQSGSYRWHLLRAVPEFSLQGNFVGWLGTLTDIHIQKRNEENKKLISEVSNLLNLSYDYEPSLNILAERVTKILADCCFIDLALPHRDFLRISRSPRYPELLASSSENVKDLETAKNFGALGLKTCKPVLLSCASDSNYWNIFSQSWSQDVAWSTIGCCCSAPILLQGAVAGSITLLNSKQSHHLENMDLEFVAELCQQISLVLEKVHLYEQSLEDHKRKDQFLAMLSHELRTPLNAVLGWSELIREECHDEKILTHLSVIERNGKILGQLVGDLLDVSRIITGKLELNKKPVDLHSMLQAVVMTMTPQAEEKSITLTLHGSRLPILEVDGSRLEQVIWNLLANAIKFTQEGGRIDVSTELNSKSVRINISDNGMGISAKMLPHIFERFRQADSSSTRVFGGLGLGLSIVKSIIEEHGGKVKAKSRGIGCGSVFTVDLPLNHLQLRQGATTQTQGEMPGANLSGHRILVVDDDWSTRTLIAKFLSNSGANVTQASSVQEAIACLESFDPEIIVTDIGMPYEDGFSLLRNIQQHCSATKRDIKTAALSAYASHQDADKALAAGFNSYLTKPIRASELISAVQNLINLPPQFRSISISSGG